MQLASFLLWFKALHVAFMVTWFAGLFYLPRLFVYHAECADEPSRRRFTLMEKRLFAIMTIGAVTTAVFGLLLLAIIPGLVSQIWFQAKLVFLAGMVVYHWRCRQWIRALESTMLTQESRGLRWFNEIPVIFLLGIILLAVLKPF
ncbi:MAG: CopD family protein [Woeseia sp.]